MSIPKQCHSTAPRPWYGNGELSNLARDRYGRRHESPLRWGEWVNVRDHVRLDIAAGAVYPAEVAGLIGDEPMHDTPTPQRPALRYHGGKWRLASWIINYFPAHVCYVEPFGGAAGVLLQKPRSRLEVYNDGGRHVVNFFRQLRERPDELVHLLNLTPYARAEFEEARDLRSVDPAADPLEAARRFFVLAWQGRGGPMARWNTGWRFQRNDSRGGTVAEDFYRLESLHLVAERLRGVQIECCDALTILDRYDTPETLFYLDPPYLPETRSKWGKSKNGNAYELEMSADDHQVLAERLNRLQGMAIISGYPSAAYNEWFAGWERVETSAQRDNGGEGGASVTEVLWLSPAAAVARLPMLALLQQKGVA